MTAVMLGVFIYELVLNAKAQGTPVSFKVYTVGLYAAIHRLTVE
jgi:hypothetical protein